MAKITVPQNCGSVRVAMGLGGKFTVWNGKHGQHEFFIPCRSRKEAEALAKQINEKRKEGAIEVEINR